MPEFKFRPNKTLLKTAEYLSIFLVAFSSLFIARSAKAGDPAGDPPFNEALPGDKRVYIQTWDQINPGMTFDTDPNTPGARQKLFGMDTDGARETSGLSVGGNSGADLNGDLIELGYFRLFDGTPNTSSTNLFAGTWTPLSEKTTIGNKHNAANSVAAGEFYMQVDFAETSGTYSGTANINALGSSAAYQITDDTPDNLGGASWNASNLWKLDDVTQNTSGSARLGLRFYDITPGSATGWAGPNASDNRSTGTRYNTIMNPDWTWEVMAGTNLTTMNIDFHDSSGNLIDADGPGQKLHFEFDNKYAAADSNGFSDDTKVGSTAITTFTTDSEKFMTSIAYYAGGTTSLDVSNAGVGSAIVSNFNSDAGGQVVGGTNENILTIHSAAGNDAANSDAPQFLGSIWVDNSNSADLTIIKTGEGEQILGGKIDLADADTNTASSYLDIHAGTVILRPADTLSQKFEYLTGASSGTRALALDNTLDGNEQTIELGFAQASTATFSGTVTLQGSSNNNTIKVVSSATEDDANYGKNQVLSGIIGEVGGAKKLVKDGIGRLTLEGDNTFSGGTRIDHGILHAAHNDALGPGAVVINKGKLQAGSGIDISESIDGGTGKSMIGGDGTFSGTTTTGSTSKIAIGSTSGYIDTVSPGEGISSSLSPSNQQVTFGVEGGGNKGELAVGTLTVTDLGLYNGGVYDWEITDFKSGANQSSYDGTDFDVLKFSTMTFDSSGSASFGINVFSVDLSSGNAGAVANIGSHTGTNGILFLDSINNDHSDITWGHANHTLSSGSWQEASYFTVDSDPYNYYNGGLNGGWSVWYNGSGDFYLRYSAVPEPSTYVMVLGMLLVPGFRFFRRFRKGIKEEDK